LAILKSKFEELVDFVVESGFKAEDAKSWMTKWNTLKSTGRNLKEFCLSHSINPGNMSVVCAGGRLKSCQGWTGEYI
jgi:hypothetical protein